MLQGISLEVGRGEFFGLLGPNGAGKTTLFKILATLVVPEAGRSRWPASTRWNTQAPYAPSSRQ